MERGWRAEVTVGQVGLRGVGPVQRPRVPTIGGEVMGSRATTFGPVEPKTGGVSYAGSEGNDNGLGIREVSHGPGPSQPIETQS